MATSVSRIQFTEDDSSRWAGMGDYALISPDGSHVVNIKYEGEPPHGDSYHSVQIDGQPFLGYAWGCLFGFSRCSRYVGFSWMLKLFERRTVVVDMREKKYFILPDYIYKLRINWPSVVGEGDLCMGKSYVFSGSEQWLSYETSYLAPARSATVNNAGVDQAGRDDAGEA